MLRSIGLLLLTTTAGCAGYREVPLGRAMVDESEIHVGGLRVEGWISPEGERTELEATVRVIADGTLLVKPLRPMWPFFREDWRPPEERPYSIPLEEVGTLLVYERTFQSYLIEIPLTVLISGTYVGEHGFVSYR